MKRPTARIVIITGRQTYRRRVLVDSLKAIKAKLDAKRLTYIIYED